MDSIMRREVPVRSKPTVPVLLLVSLHLLSSSIHLVHAEKDSNPYPWGENPNNRFKNYWNDARNVVQDFDQFSALYIKYHGCVWSECSVDNFDDDGEDRDGDEYWYQYRTQPFCANAAFSLYGTLKNHFVLPWNHCSRATYINSFFTYGGADTILESLGNSGVSTIYDDYETDDESGSHQNSVCYVVEDESDDDFGSSSTMGCSADGKQFVAAKFGGQTCDGNYFLESFDDMRRYNRAFYNLRCRQVWSRRRDINKVPTYESYSGYNNNQNENRQLVLIDEEKDHEEERVLQDVVVASEEVASLSEPEETSATLLETDHRQLEDNDNNDNSNNGYTSTVPAWILLTNSWACDIDLYPKGCPDPYGLKARYDAVLQAVSKGQSPTFAFWHQRIKGPLRFLAITCFALGTLLYLGTYYLSRRDRFKHTGFWTTIFEDVKKVGKSCFRFVKKLCKACVGLVTGETRRKRRKDKMNSPNSSKRSSSKKKKKKKKRKSRSGDMSPDGAASSDYFGVFT